MIEIPQHPRILLIVLRRLGDVLLTTPLLHSLRRGLTPASLDVLVFRGTEGMLAGNPDVSAVLTISQRPSWRETGALAHLLWRRYDLAVSTQTGDRPLLFAWLAGRRRVGLIPASGSGAWWKRRILQAAIFADGESHRVPELMRLAQLLGLGTEGELVCPAAAPLPPLQIAGRYAVLHASPMFRFRRWTPDGWRALAAALADRGLAVVATGGPDPTERAYLDELWGPQTNIVRVDGRLDWQQLTMLLRGASVYVGPDTSMTHLAAAAGCPTIALYGPASPHRIGPWPVGGLDAMWRAADRIQQRNNVWVVQNPLPCLPCEKLGCEGHLLSYSRCLDELTVDQVLTAVDQALGKSKRRTTMPLAPPQ